MLGKSPVAVFGKLVLLGKALQQTLLIGWAAGWDLSVPVFTSFAKGVLAGVLGLDTRTVTAAALIIAGQLLNYSIYKAIGKDGVYYGFKLGKSVPWSSAFPFSAGFRHPQYVGSLTSQLGVLLLLASEKTMTLGLGPLAAFWALCYLVTSLIESSVDNDS